MLAAAEGPSFLRRGCTGCGAQAPYRVFHWYLHENEQMVLDNHLRRPRFHSFFFVPVDLCVVLRHNPWSRVFRRGILV